MGKITNKEIIKERQLDIDDLYNDIMMIENEIERLINKKRQLVIKVENLEYNIIKLKEDITYTH